MTPAVRGTSAALLRRVKKRLKDRALLDLIETKCTARHATLFDVVGTSRSKSVVAARHEVWRSLFAAGLSQQEVATIFERHLDSVTHSASRSTRAARDRRAAEDAIAKKVADWFCDHGLCDDQQRDQALAEWRDRT